MGPIIKEDIEIQREIWEDTEVHKKGSHVKMKAMIGIMLPKTKEHQKPPETRNGKEKVFPIAFRGSMVLLTPIDCVILAFIPVKEYISVKSHKVCGNLVAL